ncbi:MAG: protein CreA [Methyloprofundus sp.]|nr:protein CreA [Methyloprofundus sp.]
MNVAKCLATLALASFLAPAQAEKVGHVDINFQWTGPDDKIIIESFDDPEISGVTCFLSRFKTGGFKGAVGIADDAPDSSISCRQTGPIQLPKKVLNGKKDGDDVFKKRTSLVFQSMQVVRFYDKKHNTLIYLVYSDRVMKGSAENSISAVPVTLWNTPKALPNSKD